MNSGSFRVQNGQDHLGHLLDDDPPPRPVSPGLGSGKTKTASGNQS